jgi:hypothetical protein
MSKIHTSFYRTRTLSGSVRLLLIRASIACTSVLASWAQAGDCGRGGACGQADVFEPGTGWLLAGAVVVVYVARSPSAARWANRPIELKRLFGWLHRPAHPVTPDPNSEHLIAR